MSFGSPDVEKMRARGDLRGAMKALDCWKNDRIRQAVGQGGVLIEGDVRGSTIISGDNNEVK